MGKERITPGFYFPQGTFANAYYSEHLSAMNEPSLSNVTATQVEIYRFLWLRTFHPPVAIRVQDWNDKRLLTVKQLDGKGGYEPGKLVVDTSEPLDMIQWDLIAKRIERVSFWTLARLELERADVILQELHVDGAFWVLEGVRNGQHHFVDRCNPPSGEFRDCCLYMIELSGLEADPIY